MRKTIKNSIMATVNDLHEIGVVDTITMRNLETLCLPELPEYTPEKISAIRRELKLSQAALAALMNISKSTVQKWEQGEKHPSGASQKLLNIIEHQGIDILVKSA